MAEKKATATESAVVNASKAYFDHMRESEASKKKADEIKTAAVKQLTDQGAAIVAQLAELEEKYTFTKSATVRKPRGPNKPKVAAPDAAPAPVAEGATA